MFLCSALVRNAQLPKNSKASEYEEASCLLSVKACAAY